MELHSPRVLVPASLAHKKLLDGEPSSSTLKLTSSPSTLEESLKQLSPFAGSVTARAREMPRRRVAPSRPVHLAYSMSSAPVETLNYARRATKAEAAGRPKLAKRKALRWLHACLGCIYPEGAHMRVPLGLVCFLTILGSCAATLGFMMDVMIDLIHEFRHLCYRFVGNLDMNEDLKWFLQLFTWLLGMLGFSWAAIWTTKMLAPQAAGSGIPEMKSILSGAAEGNYLSRRTLLAKVLGLVLALGGGLPLGKEGPFVHLSCCLVDSLLKLPVFDSIRRSKPLRIQMLAVACAVGVSSTFGAPMGGVLFSIEVTAQYFLVSLYWRCFFASVVGAIISRLLFSWWHNKEEFGISSMLHADDVSAEPTQLLAYVIIGASCGLVGALFVKLNKMWMDFRKAHSKHFLLRNRFAWSTIFITVFGLVSFPASPVGHFMSKGQTASINDLFNRTLSNEWHQEHLTFPFWSPSLGTLLLYIFFRFSFLVMGITLPLPCGVFAPCLAIGAGVGRIVGDAMHHVLPHMEAFVKPGGYAVLGAASMAAGVTRTISSAILIFELTGGLQHVLPILIAVVVSFVVGQCYSVSIFESILENKGLLTMPEFKNPATWMKTAKDVMLVRSACCYTKDIVKLMGLPDLQRAFLIWMRRCENSKRARRNLPARSFREAIRITENITYGELKLLLKKCDAQDKYFPYVDEADQLIGVLHKQQLEMAFSLKRRGWEASREACASQRRAAQRAYGALERTLNAVQQQSPQSQRAQAPPLARCQSSPSIVHSLPKRKGKRVKVRSVSWRRGGRVAAKQMPFGEGLVVGCEDINSIHFLGASSMEAIQQHQEPPIDTNSIDDEPPASAMLEVITRDVWDQLGLDLAPFSVQAQASMALVHFYFSQLTLHCVFVVDKGKFIGMINKEDMMKGFFIIHPRLVDA